MISEHISDDIPPQMKILNMVIPILMHFCSLSSNWCIESRIKVAHHPTKCDILNDVKLFPLSQIFEVIQSDVPLQEHVHLNLGLDC